MASPAPPLLRLPSSLTAPDALLALLLLACLQYKQYVRRQRDGRGKIHAGAKTKPQRKAAWSLAHEVLFARLRMLVSPLADQASASGLNADMVDLQSEENIGAYADKVASGKAKKKKQTKSNGGASEGQMMEVRSRRIVTGELVYDAHFPLLETTVNLALSITVGLAARWAFGLLRALRLSRAPGGPCCSPYRGGDDAGTRTPGSFERLLACALVKQEGDRAGTLILSIMLLLLLGSIVQMAWAVSSPSASKDEEGEGDVDAGEESDKKGSDEPKYRRIHPRKVKRFFVGVGATLSSLMLFHTPALLRMLGLEGLTEAVEELSARLLLFGNLLGIDTLPETTTLEAPSESLQNGLLALLAILWGTLAAGMMTPIDETARNAAHILSPSPSTKGKKRRDPQEMMDLINVRMMLLIQAMAPFVVMCTYLANARFEETAKSSSGGGEGNLSFRRQYLSNSGVFVRVAVSWCFLGASLYTFRALLQSFLDQAATVASAMATLGEGGAGSDAGQGAPRNKRATVSKQQPAPPKRDPFSERYRTLVLTAGRIAAFPAFILALLAVAHIRGGDGSMHPGIGHESLPKGAPRSNVLPVRGLLPPYSDLYMSWMIANRDSPNEEGRAGDALLHASALSQTSWVTTPFRDSTQKKIVNLAGRSTLCYPPEVRSLRAMGRNVNFLLDSEGDTEGESMLTANAFTGRELMDMAAKLPATLADIVLGRASSNRKETICKADEEECKADYGGSSQPSFSEMVYFASSHRIFTPTVVFPIVDTVAFLSSVWWTYGYSVRMTAYWLSLRGAASVRIST